MQGFGLFPQVLFMLLISLSSCKNLLSWTVHSLKVIDYCLIEFCCPLFMNPNHIPVQLSTAEGLIIKSIITAYGFASYLAALPSRPVFPYLLAVLE